MPKLILMSGGPGRRTMTWRISQQKGLSRDYAFAPGVPTDVAPADAAWFTDLANTGGRVFEAAAEKSAPAALGAGAASKAAPAGAQAGGSGGAPASTSAPAADADKTSTDKPPTGKAAGDADKS